MITMATITEDYVSFETAKLLKEKGFNQNCATYYLDGQVWRHYHGEVIPKAKQIYAAPTQAVAMKWLREVHKIGIFPSTYTFTNGDGTEEYHPYGTAIINLVTYELMTDDIMPRSSYKQACEAAIKYCLENLI